MDRLWIGAVFLIASTFASPALADWWIARSSDGKCLVVDIEPTGTDVAKVGKHSYPTAEKAEADLKRLCKDIEAAPKGDREHAR